MYIIQKHSWHCSACLSGNTSIGKPNQGSALPPLMSTQVPLHSTFSCYLWAMFTALWVVVLHALMSGCTCTPTLSRTGVHHGFESYLRQPNGQMLWYWALVSGRLVHMLLLTHLTCISYCPSHSVTSRKEQYPGGWVCNKLNSDRHSSWATRLYIQWMSPDIHTLINHSMSWLQLQLSTWHVVIKI